MLSKSQYTSYLQCSKLLWLSKHDRSKLSPPSIHLKQIMEMGSKVGKVAQGLFPGGTAIPFNLNDIYGMVDETRKLISQGVETIYEGSFLYNEVFVAVDILHYSDKQWHIYEVKSSKGVKDYYLDDAAIQYYTLQGRGLDIGTVNIININNRYTREKELDLMALFSIRDITEEVLSRQKHISGQIGRMKDVILGDEPDTPIGQYCISPFECSAHNYCWKHIPEKSVFTLTRAHWEDKFELYDSGIVKVTDIPLEDRTHMQQLQIKGVEYIDRKAIKSFLDSLRYPITHLDFESFQQAVPEYEGCKPFNQIPFQYSIHIENKNSLEHREFLGPIGCDPRRSLAEQLIKDVPSEGTVLAFNMGFEKSVIRKLAALYEDLSEALLEIVERVEDLMVPFQKGWYYHPEMNGSYSIKKVLPALVPDMKKAYKELPVVHNGGEASSLWGNLPSMDDPEKINDIRKGLLEYCKLDTLAMVEILKVLRNVNDV